MGYKDSLDGGIPLTLGIACLIFFVCFWTAQFLRPRMPWYFYPRIWNENEEKPFWLSFDNLVWLWRTIRAPKLEVSIRAGMYGLLYIRFFLFMIIYVLIMILLAIPILVPIDVLSNNIQGFAATTATSIPSGSAFLAAHTVLTIIFVMLGIVIIWWYQRTYFKTRKEFRNRDFVNSHTIKIRNLPKKVKEGELVAYLESIYPGQIVGVSIPPMAPELMKLKEEKTNLLKQLAEAEFLFQQKGDRPIISPGCCGCLLTCLHLRAKEDAMAYYKARVVDISARIQRRQKKIYKKTGCAFVTFHSAEAAHYVLRDFYVRSRKNNILKNSDPELKKIVKPRQWSTQMASRPQEVFWNNLSTSTFSKLIRRIVFSISIVISAFMWAIPVSFLASVSTLEQIPGLGYVVTAVIDFNPFFQSVIEGYLPSLLTTCLVLCLPPILTIAVTMFEKPDTLAERDASVLRHYYVFIILNVLIFQTLFIGTFDSVALLFDDGIEKILENINFSIQGAFYINYIVQQTFFTGGIRCVRHHMFALIARYFFAVTDEQKQEMRYLSSVGNEFEYRIRFAQVALVMAIVLTYAVVVPLVLPTGFLFLIVMMNIDKNNILHVYHKIICGDGSLIISVINMFLVALLTCESLTSVFFWFKDAVWAFSIMIVLIAITLLVVFILNFSQWYNMYRYITHGKPDLIEWDLPMGLLQTAYIYPGLVPEEENLVATIDNFISGNGNIDSLIKSENDAANEQFMKLETSASPTPHNESDEDDHSSSGPLNEDDEDPRNREMHPV